MKHLNLTPRRALPSLLLCLLLSLCSCSKTEASLPACSAEEAAQALMTAATFTETLEPIDTTIATALYGLDETSLQDCAAYLSTGATAEECTVLILDSSEAAQLALAGLQQRVEDQTTALESYQPQEVQKLSAALTGTLEVEGGYLAYLVVADDPGMASTVWNDFVR